MTPSAPWRGGFEIMLSAAHVKTENRVTVEGWCPKGLAGLKTQPLSPVQRDASRYTDSVAEGRRATQPKHRAPISENRVTLDMTESKTGGLSHDITPD